MEQKSRLSVLYEQLWAEAYNAKTEQEIPYGVASQGYHPIAVGADPGDVRKAVKEPWFTSQSKAVSIILDRLEVPPNTQLSQYLTDEGSIYLGPIDPDGKGVVIIETDFTQLTGIFPANALMVLNLIQSR